LRPLGYHRGSVLLSLFPLPNVVHFPGTRLPLHVFEPRYRALIADLLALPADERRIGVLLSARSSGGSGVDLLEPGCAGRLIEHEPLEDGRSNIVLEGEFRFVIDREVGGRPYRRALVRPLCEEPPLVDAERGERLQREIVALLADLVRASPDRSPLDLAALGGSARLPAHVLANRLADQLDLPALRKQMLLAEEPLDRAREVAGILRSRVTLLRTLAPYRHLAPFADTN
jgi:Lon protease-like protein